MLKRLYLRLSGERTYIFDITETVHTEKGMMRPGWSGWANGLGACEVVMRIDRPHVRRHPENKALIAQRIQR